MKHIFIIVIYLFSTTLFSYAQENGKEKKDIKKEQSDFFRSEKLPKPTSPKAIVCQVIKGIVYDEKTLEPLIGANIIEVGKRHATTTDIDGQYAILIDDPHYSVLEASFVGYVTQRQRVNSRCVVNFFLKEYTETTVKQ